ncbi:MAG: hypothetical protein CV087_22335 [Candidatus Brocadia sp. WS118]|nr:MAG: hypothetical protein CV087_22335 [Candidatus Brocadia sp. WS118]
MYYKSSMHLVNQLFNTKEKQSFKPSDVDNLVEKYKLKLNNSIEGYGVELSNYEYRALEAIQKIFSDNNFKGNIDPEKVNYSTIKLLPRVRFSQKEFFDAFGINSNSRRDQNNAITALASLTARQHFFFYKRLVYENGRPVKEGGRYKREIVKTIDTLIKLNLVFTDTDNPRLKYYEVTPSPILIDQVGLEEFDSANKGNYFLLKPGDWFDELKGWKNGKVSKYEIYFLEWLRMQYEERRKSKGSYTIRIRWDILAKTLKFPDTDIKKKKGKVLASMRKMYQMAKTLGYLKKYTIGDVDVLVLNPKKYPSPGKNS